jgi:hypothetical protein
MTRVTSSDFSLFILPFFSLFKAFHLWGGVRYDPGEHLLTEAYHSGMSYLPKGDILA